LVLTHLVEVATIKAYFLLLLLFKYLILKAIYFNCDSYVSQSARNNA